MIEHVHAPAIPHSSTWAQRLRDANLEWVILPKNYGWIRATDGRMPSQVISGSLEHPFSTLRTAGATWQEVHDLSRWEHGEVGPDDVMPPFAGACWQAVGVTVSRQTRRIKKRP